MKPLKRSIRVVGFSGGPVDFERSTHTVVGVLSRLPSYVEGVSVGSVRVDGMDSTKTIEVMTRGFRQHSQIKCVFLHGSTIAGFNVVDVDELAGDLEVPVICVVKERPDLDQIKIALRRRFVDWRRRLEVLTRREWTQVEGAFLSFAPPQQDPGKFLQIYRHSLVHGTVPEVIRLARLIATAIERGHSYGKVH